MPLGMSPFELGTLGVTGAAGLFGGLSQGNQGKINQQQLTQQQQQQALQQVLAILGRQQDMEQSFRQDGLGRATTQAQMSPLGQEQQFLQRQRLAQAMLPAIKGFQPGGPTNPAIQAAFRPPTNILSQVITPQLQQAYGDDATAQSLMDRRKLMAMINPDYEFSPLSSPGFGLGPQYDQSVSGFQMGQQAQQKGYEASQRALMEQQRSLAMQDYQNQQLQAQKQQQQEKKGGGFLGGLGKVLKIAAPVAAMAIPGIGPGVAAAIAGGGTALGSKMAGDSWGSALGQGALGAAAGGVGRSLASGGGFNPFNNGSGPQLANQMTQASLPVHFGGQGLTQAAQQLPLQSQAQGLAGLAGSVGMNRPSISGLIGTAQSGPRQSLPPMGPQFGPPASLAGPGPNTLPWGGQPTGISAAPPGSTFWAGIQEQLQQQPFVRAMQSPVGMLMGGAMGAQGRPPLNGVQTPNQQMARPQGLLPPAPTGTGLGAPGGTGPMQLGPGPTPRGLMPQYGQSTQQNMANIIGAAGRMPRGTAGPFIQRAQPYLQPENFPPQAGPGMQLISPEVQVALLRMRNPQLQQQFGQSLQTPWLR